MVMKILIIENDASFAAQLASFLLKENYLVTLAGDGKEAWELITQSASIFDVIVSEIMLPLMDGVSLLKKLRDKGHETPVILMAKEKHTKAALDAVSYDALELIIKPFEPEVLRSKLSKLTSNVLSHQELGEMLNQFEERISISIPSQTRLIRSLMIRFQENFGPIFQLRKINTYNIGLCLEEALANAIIHGNLGVPSNLKEHSWNEFNRMVKQREELPKFSKRRVVVLYILDHHQLEIIIKDEGNGFDYTSLPNPNDPENFLSSGRGLLIIRHCMDKVNWNESGNMLQMIKLI